MVQKGATVIMACRDAGRAQTARTQIITELSQLRLNSADLVPLRNNRENDDVEARLQFRALDLCSHRSVRAFVEGLERDGLAKRIDILILNAGGPSGTPLGIKMSF